MATRGIGAIVMEATAVVPEGRVRSPFLLPLLAILTSPSTDFT